MEGVVIREPKSKELEKIERLMLTAFPVVNPHLYTLILTVPKPSGEGRYIVGAVSIADNLRRICQLVVSKDYRRKGLGTLLLKHAVSKIGKEAYLRVKMWNWRAVRMYWKHGFRITGIRNKSFVMSMSKPKPIKVKVKRVEVPVPSVGIIKDGKIYRQYHPDNARQYARLLKARIPLKNGKFTEDGTIRDLVKVDIKVPVEIPSVGKLTLKEVAQAFINGYIFKSNSDHDTYHAMLNIKTGEWNDWETKEGKWITRLERALYKYSQIKISTGAKTWIGNYVSDRLESQVLLVELSTQFRQEEGGLFGDSGSCWYSFQSYHPKCLFSNGKKAYVFKVYNAKGTRLSRAWLYYSAEHDCLVMFNKRGRMAGRMEEILSVYLGIPVDKVRAKISSKREHDHYTDNGDDRDYFTYPAFGVKLPDKLLMRWCDD